MRVRARIPHLTTDEIAAALAAEYRSFEPDQVRELKKFVWRTGGLENARRAVELLAESEQAA